MKRVTVRVIYNDDCSSGSCYKFETYDIEDVINVVRSELELGVPKIRICIEVEEQ